MQFKSTTTFFKPWIILEYQAGCSCKSAGYGVTRQAAAAAAASAHFNFMMTVVHFRLNPILNNMQHLRVETATERYWSHFKSKSDVTLNSLLSNSYHRAREA